MNSTPTTNPADGCSALVPHKKPKPPQPDFADARRACRTATEREQLALILRARWTSAELQEYSRLHYFKNGRDYPTPSSYRRAIGDLAKHYHLMTYTDAKPSQCPHEWLKGFRENGSKPMPPRREGLLIRGRGLTHKINCEEYSWPGHTEEFRALIEQRCRDYFENMPPDQPVHVNAWAASHRAYQREQRAAKVATEAANLVLSPKRSTTKASHRKIVSSFEYVCEDHQGPLGLKGPLKPHFNLHFKHHTPEFREEVAALARKEHGLQPSAPVSARRWKLACHKNYYLIESPTA